METLKKNYEFLRVYRKGKYFSGKYLTINVLENAFLRNRVGISVSRKAYKSSVKRNLYRRRIKEILRTGNFNLKNGYDMVFVVKKTDEIPEYHEIEKEIVNLLDKAKLIIKNEKTDNRIIDLFALAKQITEIVTNAKMMLEKHIWQKVVGADNVCIVPRKYAFNSSLLAGGFIHGHIYLSYIF